MVSKRIVIATIGSLGDLHPCLALALELQRRGHTLTLAATEFYRARMEALGLAFHPMRPHWDPTDPELIGRCEELKRGPEVLYRQMVLPELPGTYADLLAAATGADLLIAGELVYAAPLIAEKLGLRWVSAILSPSSFFSAHDPSVLVNAPWLMWLHTLGVPAYRAGLAACQLAVQHWSRPVQRLRSDLGLRRRCDPVFRDKFSPDLVLALFSSLLGRPQPDWPAQTVQTGFVGFDSQPANASLSPELNAFLTSGDAPIVFTQGSTAAHNPGAFYKVSVEAARLVGRRALLLGVRAAPADEAPDVFALAYAPYLPVFPQAAVIVHQGGSGTTGVALRSGRPMLIVPYGWDQPDNAARVERLGAGIHLARSKYSAATGAAALKRLMEQPHFAARAAAAKAALQQENGVTDACDAMEAVLRQPG